LATELDRHAHRRFRPGRHRMKRGRGKLEVSQPNIVALERQAAKHGLLLVEFT
jgi:hypothetical protein